MAFVDDTPANIYAAQHLGWHARLVCLLKNEILETATQLSGEKLAEFSVNSKNLVFGDEAARRVEVLFSKLIAR